MILNFLCFLGLGATGNWGSTLVKSKLTWSQICPVNIHMYETYWLETYFIILKTNLKYGSNHCFMESKDNIVVRALAFHKCGLGSNPSVNTINKNYMGWVCCCRVVRKFWGRQLSCWSKRPVQGYFIILKKVIRNEKPSRVAGQC